MGNTACDTTDGQTFRGELSREKERRRFSVDARGGGENHLLGVFLDNPCEQTFEWQLLGADAVEGREQSPQHEIAATHGAAAFDGEEVLNAGDDAEQVSISPPILTDRAHGPRALDLCQIATLFAGTEPLLEGHEFRSQALRELGIGHQLQGESLCGLLSDAWKATQELDDATQGFR